jgi:hypothetical protein
VPVFGTFSVFSGYFLKGRGVSACLIDLYLHRIEQDNKMKTNIYMRVSSGFRFYFLSVRAIMIHAFKYA